MLINQIKVVFTMLLLLVNVAHASDTVPTTVLLFDEIESGVEPYVTRYLITDGMLRIDEGRPEDSFVLFNVKSGVIHSISRSDQSILKIPFSEKFSAPELQNRFDGLETRLKVASDSQGPKIAGIQAIDYELTVGETICARFSAVQGLLVDELSVLKAYEKVIASNTTQNISNQPLEYITDCMLANELYAADLYLSKGFPIITTRRDGLQRFLKDYMQAQPVDAALFDLPVGYSVFSMGDKIGL